jgi:hypothetical protein
MPRTRQPRMLPLGTVASPRVELGYIIGPVIGAGATVLGVTLTSRRDDRIRCEGRESSRRAQLEQAMWRYLAAIDALTVEATGELPPQAQPLRIDPWLMKFAKLTGLDFIGFILSRLLQRAIYGNRHNQLADRLADASAHLRLIAPPAVEAFMVEGEELSKRHEAHDDEWLEDWMDFRRRMRAGFRDALGAPEAAPAR